MRILSIETSCDETSAAVVEKDDKSNLVKVLSNITATSLAIHATTGGIIPENAAREQVKYIIPTITKALLESSENNNPKEILKDEINAIAITYGPGLIGSLLVGVETTKTLSFIFDKPIIPVNHLLAHLFANYIDCDKITFPFIGLIVSGGHTDLLYFESIDNYKWIGGTRDDAAGEALDKIGRLLDLSYPAGPEIEQRASKFNEKLNGQKAKLRFVSPLIGSGDFDFSFSGLKAEVGRFVKNKDLTDDDKNEICYAVQKAIFDVLVKKTIRASKVYETSTILIGGGVSANQTLLNQLRQNKDITLFSPKRKYSTDNGAMIGAYAVLNPKEENWKNVSANPDLYFDNID